MRKIRQGRAVEFRDGTGVVRPDLLDKFLEHLDARAVAVKLAGREHVDAHRTSRSGGPHRSLGPGTVLIRDDVAGLPVGHLLGQLRPDQRFHIVLWPRRAESPHQLLLGLSGLRIADDLLLFEDHGVKLLAHPAGPGLLLDLIPVDHPPAIRKGTGRRAAGYGRLAVLPHGVDDLKPDPALGRIGEIRQQAHAGAIAAQDPVRRQRHHAPAVRAGDRACPEVSIVSGLALRAGYKTCEPLVSASHESRCRALLYTA
jgi:hypothetical protein